MSKLTKHGAEGSHTDLKKLGKSGNSSTNLKKNNSSSQVSLKRNKSTTDVKKVPKSPRADKPHTSVRFEIGDQDDWEEASSTASPALSRSASQSAQSSAKASANNSQAQSPLHSQSYRNQPDHIDGGSQRPADGKLITERLLQRTPSYHTTKMSLATATPTRPSPELQDTATLNGTPKNKDGTVSSRFVGGSGTPGENSPFLNEHKPGSHDLPQAEEVKRARSMGNLTRRDSNIDSDDAEESALAQRGRKASNAHTHNIAQQSRTQQKLWLQRASSTIESQQPAPGVAMNVLVGIYGGLGGSSLIGAGYDGKDPRIKVVLERTGLEYMVVRRHQDPIGKALKRLAQIPGMERNLRIPANRRGESAGAGRQHGLSQSLKERSSLSLKERSKVNMPVSAGGAGRTSFDRQSIAGSQEQMDGPRGEDDDEGVGALLRTLWEKNFDLSGSAD